jgi:hypothetical protein
MKGYAVAAASAVVALLTFLQFPGHTYLQQDSQIYAPILEHLRDPAVLRNDILAQRPHVAYTLYDELTLFLRRVSGMELQGALTLQQIVTRTLGIWGLYLMATSLGLSSGYAMLVAAICSLGATIVGPAVLTIEYEPTPRAFAVPLLIFGIGLASRGRYLAAGIAGAAAFLYHPPTTIPFWIVFVVLVVIKPRYSALLPLGGAAALLLLAAGMQGGGSALFGRLTPSAEHLQKIRASYVRISMWPVSTVVHHFICFAAGLAALWRIRKETSFELRIFLVGLPILGMLSMPLSWLLLERIGWSLMPQLQPMRALLFIALAMQFCTASAGALALTRQKYLEAAGWFVLAYLLPLQPVVTHGLVWTRIALAAALAVCTALARRYAPAVALGAFFVIPVVGGVVNYPHLHTPELAELSGWAQSSTAVDSVFLFPDAGRALYPGIFRAKALRAVYVDWKGGGQVNYLKDFGDQWWFRWQQTMAGEFKPLDFYKYSGLGVQYVVLQAKNRLAIQPAFENQGFVVYRVP